MPDCNPFPDDPEEERQKAFAFEQTGPDEFRSQIIPTGLLRQYGGMVVAQALAAAQATVPADKRVHSLHAYFLKPGRSEEALTFSVRRMTDGRSFSARQVDVSQAGAPIITLIASFQVEEHSREHGFAMPDVPPPEHLTPLEDLIAAVTPPLPERHRPFWTRRQQIDWRPVEAFHFHDAPVLPPQRHFWFRMHGNIDAPPHVQQCWLVYASDFHIFQASFAPMGISWADDYLQTSSLDHAIWFHNSFRMDEWMLYAIDTPAASHARGLGRGNIFRRDGTLIATVSQQGLVRELDRRREGKI